MMRRFSFFCIAILFAVHPAALRADPVPAQRARAELIGSGIAWFVPSDYDPEKTPSLALKAEPVASGPVPDNWTIRPTFFQGETGAGATLSVPEDASLYGTGEVVGPLLRNGRTIELWNTDNYVYGKDGGRRLYQSHPWVLGVRRDGTAFGVLFDTTWRGELKTESGKIALATWGGPFRVAVIDRESPKAVLKGLVDLTGNMPLPPLWSLGFHQCRYSYFPDAKVREIADEFRKRKLPCDAIWLDIHYMDGYRIFTFAPKLFPDPKGCNRYLHERGFRSVWILDPGVKIEKGYSVYESGAAIDAWVKTASGEDFVGEVWPGRCVFPDFTRPETRAWWAGLNKAFVANGIDGVWNDMNEPSVFQTSDWSMPEENRHRGGDGLPPGTHRLYHNVYGMLMARSTREGMLAARPDVRPFVLTRSNHLGGHRYGATWTGDNVASMEHLRLSVPMSISLGLSGQPVSGPDIGGYTGACSPELFGHWISLGTFYPFSRAHTAVNNPPREPWTFGREIENVSRTALERRYRLMPYLYTKTRLASETGEPIMQPVLFADPADPSLRSEEQAFLFGADLLVIPRWAENPKLPKGIWRAFSLLDANRENDGYQPEIRIRGGAIVPLGSVAQSTSHASLDPLPLVVCLDENGWASGELYEDAGDGFAYRDGQFALTRFEAVREGDGTVIRLAGRDGNLPVPARVAAIELVSERGITTIRGDLSRGIRIR